MIACTDIKNPVFTQIVFLRCILPFFVSNIFDVIQVRHVCLAWQECIMEYMEETWKKIPYNQNIMVHVTIKAHINLFQKCTKHWPKAYIERFGIRFYDKLPFYIGFEPNLFDLVLSFQSNNTEMLDILLCNMKKENERACFCAAIKRGRLDVIELAIKKGADPHFRDNCDRTILHEIHERYIMLPLAKLLLRYGFDPNSQSAFNKTPLHIYCNSYCGDYILNIITLLLEHGANPNLKDTEGNTALHLAKTSSVKNILLKYGAK